MFSEDLIYKCLFYLSCFFSEPKQNVFFCKREKRSRIAILRHIITSSLPSRPSLGTLVLHCWGVYFHRMSQYRCRNVRGLNEGARRDAVQDLVRDTGCTIACLQETLIDCSGPIHYCANVWATSIPFSHATVRPHAVVFARGSSQKG